MKANQLTAAMFWASATFVFAADPYAEHGLFIGGTQRTPIDGLIAADAKRQSTANAAQRAAADAAAAQRNEAASIGVDARIVAFLNTRIADGSADAAYDLGVRYTKGQGVVADPKQARKLMETAATRGNSDAAKWLSTNRPPVELAATNAVPTTAPAAAP